MKTLWNDEDGSVLPLTAVAFPALLAVAALALDVGYWYSRSTKMSNIADASAISGATALLPVDATSVPTSTIEKVTTIIAPANADSAALKTGETAAVKAADVEFGYWDTSAASDNICSNSGGSFAAGANYPVMISGFTTANAIRVSANHSNVPTFFYGVVRALFGGPSDPFTISRCAVAEHHSDLSCFYILNPLSNSWFFNGNMTVNATTCAISSAGGIDGVGNSNIVHGDYICTKTGTDDSEINADVPVDECNPAPTDPYSTLSYTTPSSPVISNDTVNYATLYTGGGVIATDSKGNGLTVGNGKTLTLNNGIYYVNASLDVRGSLNMTNATIVLAKDAKFGASGGGNLDLDGRTIGGTKFAIIQNVGTPSVPSGSDQCYSNTNVRTSVSLGGNGNIKMAGTIYLKNTALQLQGGPTYSMTGVSFVTYELCMGGTGVLTITPDMTGPKVFTEVHLVQ
jgi:Flp pilus assembly protein TadG